ncbi:FecCD family ABC transporter permease [Mycetocola tolaasinivorans]|uniref:FecCD family ABC transporter permease n=1 Tax=Mycetocola tolaasinivorans TaxID=76635 RepID=UPI001C7D91B4|nr:iron chelate uptake ABC transporter family permease subunit [Mycetocola tolaasinivorans]
MSAAPHLESPVAAAAPALAGRRAPRLFRIGPGIALPVHPRALIWSGIVLVGLIVAAVLTLSMGKLGIAPQSLPAALFDPPRGAAGFTLTTLRGPRLLVAIGVGAALGISGALFQIVTRNPLGSPDVIGLGAGAGAGVAICGLLWPGVLPTPAGALLGAMLAITIVYLSTGRGFAAPARIIIAGIGVSAMAHAVTQYVVSVKLRDEASQLAGYLAGSINSVGWGAVGIIAITLALCLPAAWALSPSLNQIALGDSLAHSLGIRVTATRTAAIIVAVVAAAGAVTVAGPISFVALTAPQIAQRLTRSPALSLGLSALLGALILVVADLLAQQAPWARGLPVGILTAGVGGIYLGALLIREWRKGRL